MNVAGKVFLIDGRRDPDQHVVARLKRQLSRAREMGLCVRMELLGDEQASWCEIAGVPTLFVDLSQTAAEQLRQVEETLRAYETANGVTTDDFEDQPSGRSIDPQADRHAA